MTGHEIHTRTEAAALGLAKYWPGVPCRKAHNSFRYTASGACCSCVAGYRSRFVAAKDAATTARRGGLVPFAALVHPEDMPAVQQLVDALAMARRIMA